MKTNNIITNLKDYMFTTDNLNRITKHMIVIGLTPPQHNLNVCKQNTHMANEPIYTPLQVKTPFQVKAPVQVQVQVKAPVQVQVKAPVQVQVKAPVQVQAQMQIYKPKQKDSLFWCFYILKHGFFNYEMEINNQYFVVEKAEKFKYIEQLRNNKDILKVHKIKPFTELEDDLANKDKISVKTFFALCIMENINILIVDNRKFYELTCIDIDDTHKINIIHRNSKSHEHYIELDINDTILNKYRETYLKLDIFDTKLKGMSSYKISELTELCKKLNINIENKKMLKKDIYERLVQNY